MTRDEFAIGARTSLLASVNGVDYNEKLYLVQFFDR